MSRETNPQPTLAEWRTRAKQAEALAWKRYKALKKLRAEIRQLRAGQPIKQVKP